MYNKYIQLCVLYLPFVVCTKQQVGTYLVVCTIQQVLTLLRVLDHLDFPPGHLGLHLLDQKLQTLRDGGRRVGVG